jgi:hypothetical protein
MRTELEKETLRDLERSGFHALVKTLTKLNNFRGRIFVVNISLQTR